MSLAHQLEVTVRGGQGSGKSTLIRAIIDAAHGIGLAVDVKSEGYFVGGTWRSPTDKRKRILLEEVRIGGARDIRRRIQRDAEAAVVSESEPHRRWLSLSGARHTAVLALISIAIMAAVLSVIGAS